MKTRAIVLSLALVTGLLGTTSAAARPQGFRDGEPRVLRVEQPTDRLVDLAGANAGDGLSRALARGSISRAEYALDRARSFFKLGKVRARYGHVVKPGPRDLTMVLRDLAALKSELSPSQREVADRFFLRPDDAEGESFGSPYTGTSESACNGDFCVHWATGVGDPNLPPASDVEPANGRPDFVDAAITTMTETWTTEIDTVGFRSPKGDSTSGNPGPDGTLDVYLADLGSDGIYGYCTTDDPNTENGYAFYDMSSYCVVDNDMIEFPNQTPVDNLRVTVAHEFFHAVQFAYDWLEDIWFMEGTAAWIEDVVYDDINDNYGFLFQSPLLQPYNNLDYWHPDDPNANAAQYGTWIWWRYMSEALSATGSHDPSVVLDVWSYADDSATPGAPQMYSIQAVEQVVADRGYNFPFLFADFGVANFFADLAYEEGADFVQYLADNGAPTGPPLNGVIGISKAKKKKSKTYGAYQLTNTYWAFVPKKGVKSTAKLLVSFDMPPVSKGSVASIAVLMKNGTFSFVYPVLSGDGNGKAKVKFSKKKVAAVLVITTNASTSYQCWQGTVFSCQGIPLDDNLNYKITGTLKQ